MIVVLDTNVLVSGLLSPFGPCAEILRMLTAEDLQLCLDARILREYDEVLHRPRFGFELEKVQVLLDFIPHTGIIVPSRPLGSPLPDPDDEPFLQVAIAGAAACFVTGNPRHFPQSLRQGVKLLSPAEFLRDYAANALPPRRNPDS
jgi:putative PIN family toxin of toxin-antitoxin system